MMVLMKGVMMKRHSGPCHTAEGTVRVGAPAEELALPHDKLSEGLEVVGLLGAAADVMCRLSCSAQANL